MARSFLPDPLELLRQAVNRLEGRANTTAGRGLEIDQVVKTVQQMSGLSLVLRQAVEMAIESAYKRLKLPSSREFAEMQATLRRLEDKLDSLLAAQAVAAHAHAQARGRAATRQVRKTAQDRRSLTPAHSALIPARNQSQEACCRQPAHCCRSSCCVQRGRGPRVGAPSCPGFSLQRRLAPLRSRIRFPTILGWHRRASHNSLANCVRCAQTFAT